MPTVLAGSQVSPSGEPGPQGVPAIPIGSVVDFAGANAPTGWLLCYGQAISRTTYATLFNNIGIVYGAGDGSSTFNLPDCRGRVLAGDDNMGGTAANRLTTAGSGIDGKTAGAVGGSETVSLALANIPAHTHAGVDHLHSLQNHQHYTNVAVVNYQGTARGGSGTFAVDNTNVWSSGPNVGTTGASDRALTTGSTGSGTAYGNAQPTIIFNKIIYTGVMS